MTYCKNDEINLVLLRRTTDDCPEKLLDFPKYPMSMLVVIRLDYIRFY